MSTVRANQIQTLDGRIILDTAGSILQCVVVRYDVRTSFSCPTSGSGTNISGLNLTVTPRNAANRIICNWMINGEFNNENALFTVLQNGAIITTSGAEGYNNNVGNQRWSGMSTSVYDRDNNSTPQNTILTWSGIAGSTISRSYSPGVRSSNTTARTFFINRTVGSTGTNGHEQTYSTGVLWEVAV